MIYSLNACHPEFRGKGIFVAPGADLIGSVILHEDSNIWFNVTLRGDLEPITVGEASNIQDGSSLHTDLGLPVLIGKRVTVGHNCVIHGCFIGDDSLIGMGSTLLSGATIGKNCLIGAGSLITGSMLIPDDSLAMGSPAKVIRRLHESEKQEIQNNALHYLHNKKRYLEEGIGKIEKNC